MGTQGENALAAMIGKLASSQSTTRPVAERLAALVTVCRAAVAGHDPRREVDAIEVLLDCGLRRADRDAFLGLLEPGNPDGLTLAQVTSAAEAAKDSRPDGAAAAQTA